MSDKQPVNEPEPPDESERQVTERGFEIPVPKRDDFFGNLDKLTQDER